MDPESGTNSDGVREATGPSESPDPRTADILARRARGEKLSPQEWGSLRWIKAKFPSLFRPKVESVSGPAQSTAQPGNAARVETTATTQAPDRGAAYGEADARIARRCAQTFCKRSSSIASKIMGNAARKAQLPDDKVARFESAAALSVADQELIVDLAPDAMREWGIDIRQAPGWAILGTLGVWAAELTLAVQELKSLELERKAATQPNTPATSQPTPFAGLAIKIPVTNAKDTP